MGRLFDLRRKFISKEIHPRDYFRSLLLDVRKKNEKLNCYLEIFEDDFERAADLTFDEAKPLSCMPIAIKDMISIRGKRLSAASRMLENYRAPRSATVTERLEEAGAFFVGRAHCDEFAMGSSNENGPFGPARNPFDLTRTPGGSSGGSASAVAAETCVGSLGTDTGGSIRLPAAFCGLTGLKPTYGRVSRSGVIAFASSLDQVGPFADDALDCAALAQVIAGRDPRDATTAPAAVPSYTDAVARGTLKGLRIGLPKEYFLKDGVSADIQKYCEQAIDLFKSQGAILSEVSLPHSPYGIAAYYLVATAEAASNLARYDGIRYGHRARSYQSLKDLIAESRTEGFGEEVKRRIMLGTFALSSGYYDAFYSKAQFVRSKIQQEFLEAFKKVDVLFTPVSPVSAFPLGSKVNDPLQLYLLDIFTVSCNLGGVPAIAFPMGYDSLNLPVGGQFIAGPYQEARLFEAVGAFERACPFKKRALAC